MNDNIKYAYACLMTGSVKLKVFNGSELRLRWYGDKRFYRTPFKHLADDWKFLFPYVMEKGVDEVIL